MIYEQVMRVGEIADDLDALIGALAIPLPNASHVDAIRAALPPLRERLRNIFIAEVGENPWDD